MTDLRSAKILSHQRNIQRYARLLATTLESDILADGSLDYPDDVLERFDFVVASVHSRFKLDPQSQTDRIIRAVANPYTTILGHMTGRELLRRPGYKVDIESILEACATYGVAVEINANPWGLELDWRWHQRAIELGCIMSINPDAHSTREIDLTHRGCGDGAEGRGPANRVLNCLTIAQLMEHLRKRKKCSPVRPDFSDLKKDNPHAHARRREEIAEKVTGWARPSRDNLSALVRDRKASTLRLQDDG